LFHGTQVFLSSFVVHMAEIFLHVLCGCSVHPLQVQSGSHVQLEQQPDHGIVLLLLSC
jgi:hypothetical protein